MRVIFFFGLTFSLAACGGGGSTDDAGGGGGGDGGDGGVTFDAGMADAGNPACATRDTTLAPTPRGELTGVIDSANGRLVVVGGNTSAPVMCMPMTTLTAETWAYHLDCGDWTALPATGGPGARSRQAAALDEAGHRMLVFGGRSTMGFGTYVNYNDVYAFDLMTDAWSQVTTSGTGPSTRSSATAVVDAAHHRLLVFGGNTSTSGLTLTGVNDFFALDLATNTWSAVTATGAPSARLYHAATMLGHEMIVYGGTPNFSGPFLGDAYAFDVNANTWRTITSGTGGPVERFGAALVPDATRARVVVFGGHDGGAQGNRNDVWALDVATGAWTMVRPGDTPGSPSTGLCMFPPDFTAPEDGSPERRYALAADVSGPSAIFFGGKTDCGIVNDVWSLDLAMGAWTKLRTSTGGEACNRTGSTTCTTLCF